MAAKPILISRKETAATLSISRGMVDKLVRQGVLEPVRFGKRVLFRRDLVEELTLPPSRRRAFRNIDLTVPLQ
jgi:excisionase family DNA binding protein